MPSTIRSPRSAARVNERPRLDASVRGPRATIPHLSVIVPAFNEERTIREVLERVLSIQGIDLEVLVVNDGSSDRTARLAEEIAAADERRRVRVLHHPANLGKGAAIRTALRHSTAELVVIQDADLEYDPTDLPRLVACFEDPDVTAAYGSRWMGPGPRPWASWTASWLAARLTRLLYRHGVTDTFTCYKMLRSEFLRSLALTGNGFEFCAEVTARLLAGGHDIAEVPVSYRPRSRREGKKIRARDGVRAAWVMVKVWREQLRELGNQRESSQWRSSHG